MIKITNQKRTSIITITILSAIIIGITFVGANITPVFANDLCNTTVLVNTTLAHDENCTAAGGITIGADNLELDLNGFSINCTGAGYLGSCQGLGTIGVDTQGHNDASIVNGVINGFTIGVDINGGTAAVNNMLITGPVSPGAGANPRPASQAIFIQNVACPAEPETQVNVNHSELENHTEGIQANNASCLTIHQNNIHDNNSDPLVCRGIDGNNVDNSNIHHNTITANGENLAGDAGMQLDSGSTGNNIHNNSIDNNNGDGLVIDAPGNDIKKNSMNGNTFGDYREIPVNGVVDNNLKKNNIGVSNP